MMFVEAANQPRTNNGVRSHYLQRDQRFLVESPLCLITLAVPGRLSNYLPVRVLG